MYPRTIQIDRPTRPTQPGARGYSATSQATMTRLFSDLVAEVQMNRKAGKVDAGVPGDAPFATGYEVYIPSFALKRSADIRRGDIVTDDLGKRYQVSGPYWNVLGWKLSTTLLQT